MKAYALCLAAAAAVLASAGHAEPARAQEADCAAAARSGAKPRGAGGLLGGLRSSGLEGALMGAARGEGDLRSDLTGALRVQAERAATTGASRAAACAARDGGSDEGAQDDVRPVAAAPVSATERARQRQRAADAQYPSRMPIPPEWVAAKASYDEFGKVRCSDCEGGYAYSGWPDWPRDEFAGKHNGTEMRLSRLPVGHVHLWSGNGFAGSLTIVGEETVAGFRCRKMLYRLEKGDRSAERPGLICWGKANEYAASDSWVGVF